MAELAALRRVIAELDAFIASAQTVPTGRLAGVLEQHVAGLPPDSALRGQLEGLAARLRADSAKVIAESRIRAVAAKLRQRADSMARFVETRDARLSDRR